jgi:(p)ppGpp synthase/HD superfamily hydrolase
MASDSLEASARRFAQLAHEGQLRKYSKEPYIVHPEAVAELVRSVGHTEEMLAGAWLHDVVEDTPVSIDDIHREFGAIVGSLVSDLTDVSKPSDGNRARRKALDLRHSERAGPQDKTIKLADLIDNSKSIVRHDPSFARVYMREKAALLDVLREGDPELHERARRILAEYRTQARR